MAEAISAAIEVEIVEATADEIAKTIKSIDATGKAVKLGKSKSYSLRVIRDWVVDNGLASSLEEYVDQMFETKEVVWVSVIDQNTAPFDASLNGQVFKYDDVARPYPPLHPNCRCRVDPIPDAKFNRHAWDI